MKITLRKYDADNFLLELSSTNSPWGLIHRDFFFDAAEEQEQGHRNSAFKDPVYAAIAKLRVGDTITLEMQEVDDG